MKADLDQTKIESLSKVFQTFAERECKQVSNLYYQLSHEVSKEVSLLELAANSQKRQPIPNLFFGAIHFLLLKSPHEALAQYYPSISKQHPSRIPINLVREFCKKREADIIDILKTRIVQTNAINRAAYLMPVTSSLFGVEAPVNIVDIGTSSGLTMNFELYEYHYGENLRLGKSKVKIKSEILGDKAPVITGIPTIARKIGIDQNPLDLAIENNALWLKALIWPDLEARFERIAAAIEVAGESNIELYQGDTPQAFENIIEQIPHSENLLVYHTHVLYQFDKMERQAFREMLDEVGKGRNYEYLAVEANVVFDKADYTYPGVLLELTTYSHGIKKTKILGETDGHANWITWR